MTPERKKAWKFPAKAGPSADRLMELRLEKAKAQRVVDELDEEESALKQHLIQLLPKDGATGTIGKVAKAVVVMKAKAKVDDWDEFYKHILKTKDFSLMQRRVADQAVKERWEAEQDVPGVTKFTYLDISLTKA